MPTNPGKARHLLKEGKAKVIQRKPFTIQLLYGSSGYKQDITLGIDAGYSFVGFSAITSKEELISGDLELLKGMKSRIKSKSQYRRTRRGRLWHREPRFNNRSKPKGWLAPSLQHKLDSHIKLVDRIKSILPITNVIVEVASFDAQKIQNPEITGIEYQQGTLQGYEIREYLLEKWNRKCAYCGKKNVPLEVEHIIPKSRRGTNRVDNLTLACRSCNQSKGSKTSTEFGHPHIQSKAKKSLIAIPFMNVIRRRILILLKCDHTYGYITKHNRIALKIPKSHSNDAFVIAGGSTQEQSIPYTLTQTRRNNRKLQLNRKVHPPSIRRQRYKNQPNDLVLHNGTIWRSKGTLTYGKYIKVTDSSGKNYSLNTKEIEVIQYGKGIQFI